MSKSSEFVNSLESHEKKFYNLLSDQEKSEIKQLNFNLDDLLKHKVVKLHEDTLMSVINAHFFKIVHRKKLTKKRFMSFENKYFMFKHEDCHIAYKVIIASKRSFIPAYEIAIFKEIATEKGKIFAQQDTDKKETPNLIITNHAVLRCQERLNLETYNTALLTMIKEYREAPKMSHHSFAIDMKGEDFFYGLKNDDLVSTQGSVLSGKRGLIYADKKNDFSIVLVKTFIDTQSLNQKKSNLKKLLDMHNPA